MSIAKETTSKPKIKQTFIQAVGRRREANAQVRLYPISGKNSITLYGKTYKSGDFLVNKIDVANYFPGEINKIEYRTPFVVTKTLNHFAVSVVVRGGGRKGQLRAATHGISRALDKIDSKAHHIPLKQEGLLTRDPRVKERRKAGLAQKARAKKSSPKR